MPAVQTRNVTKETEFDVIVVGGGEAGAMAAIGAARRGARVLLAAENRFLGGHQGWTISFPDVEVGKNPFVIVGAAKEYFRKVAKNRGARRFSRYIRTGAYTKPAWAQRAWSEMLAAEKNITVILDAPLRAVGKTGTGITGVTLGANIYTAACYVEATVNGDLIRMAGLSSSVGRESTALHGESTAGVKAASALVGGATVDPYVTPGVSGSGLIYGIDPGVNGNGTAPETIGSGDGRVMPFSYRLFWTSVAEDKIPFPAPDMAFYNAAHYELLGRAMASQPSYYADITKVFTFYDCGGAAGSTPAGPTPLTYADINDASILSSVFPVTALVQEYVDATPERRVEIEYICKQYTLGLLHWIQNSGDSRIPAALKTSLAYYGFSNKEWKRWGGFPPLLYVREGRRLVGDFVFDTGDFAVANGFAAEAIAIGYYSYDSKRIRFVVDAGVVKSEGEKLNTIGVTQFGFPIPAKILWPKVTECTNLVVVSQPSISREAFLSLRMSPVLMEIGYAGGVASSMVAEYGGNVQDVDVGELTKTIDLFELNDKVIISTSASSAFDNQGGVTFAGTWTDISNRFPFIGTRARTAAAGSNTQTHNFDLWKTGTYEVCLMYPPANSIANGDAGRATNLTVTINSLGVATAMTINQQYPGGNGGFWESLGTFTFRYGAPSADNVVITAVGADGIVATCAVGLRLVE